jgi:hypothetical protein
MSITNRQAYEKNYSDFQMETTQHDEIASEALGDLHTIKEHLIDTGGNDIAVLALETLSRGILNMINAAKTRNRQTYIFLADWFDNEDMSVPKGLKSYEDFVNGRTAQNSPWC